MADHIIGDIVHALLVCLGVFLGTMSALIAAILAFINWKINQSSGGGMKYRKKPVVIEAEQFTEENKDRVFNFVRCNKAADFEDGEPVLRIQTLEGVMTARIDDWVIRGVNGEFYPCKPDIFAATYEPVEEVEP